MAEIETEPVDDTEDEVLPPKASPVPTEVTVERYINPQSPRPEDMNFYDAVKRISEGSKVTKAEWNDSQFYGTMDNGVLKLHKPDGKLYEWIISDGDIAGTDYVVVI